MLKGSPERTMRMSDAMRSAVMVDKARDARRWVLISVALFVVACGLSIVFFVGSFVREVTQAVDPFDGDTSTTTKTADLHTAEGWSGLVDAVEGETGTSRVHDAVVYPEYASMDTVVADGAQRRSYRDGTLDEGFGGSSTPSSGATVDLADIDPDVLAGLPRATAKSLDIDDPDASYILINARSGRPTMTVYVQTLDGSARWVIYDLDGQAVGGSTV